MIVPPHPSVRVLLSVLLVAGWVVWCACDGVCVAGGANAAMDGGLAGPGQSAPPDDSCCSGGEGPTAPGSPTPSEGDCPHCDGALVTGWATDEPLTLPLHEAGPLTAYLLDRGVLLTIDTPPGTLSGVGQPAMPPPHAVSLRDQSCLLQV